MTRQAFTIAAIAFVCGTAAAAPLVTYESPCECRDYHGKGRLTEKNDAALPPTDPNAIQAAGKGVCAENALDYVHPNIPGYYVETPAKVSAAGISVAAIVPFVAGRRDERRGCV